MLSAVWCVICKNHSECVFYGFERRNKAGKKIFELKPTPAKNYYSNLNVLLGVCKRFKTDYYHATPKQREFIDAVATHEYQLTKAHEKGLSRASVPPFMGMKRSERSNNMPA